MSKGSRGNKEAKKPKRVVPVVRAPTPGHELPPAPKRSGTQERK